MEAEFLLPAEHTHRPNRNGRDGYGNAVAGALEEGR
jgi:hypothetical protein